VKLVPRPVREALQGQKTTSAKPAVAKAVQHPTICVVPIKNVDQLDLQAVHRGRSRLVSQRTAD
jgi:transposase